MYSKQDFERLWFLYKTEGEPNLSTRSALATIFHTLHLWLVQEDTEEDCISRSEGIPEELIQTDNEHQDLTKDKPKRTSLHRGSIVITIRIHENLCI